MLRSVSIAVLSLIVLGQTVLQAEDAKQPKTTEKSAVKQIQKKQPVLLQKADKTNQPQKQKPAAATLGSDVEYYTTSPAQGRPADGRLPAGTKVKVVEKAGSYVRVMAVIEAYVPADSLKAPDKPVNDKAAASKKKAAAEKGAAVEKKAAVDKAALKKKAIAEKKAAAAKKSQTAIDQAALKKKALAEKKAAAEKEATPIDKAALKKKASAEKKAAANKETEKKVEKK